MCMVGLRGHLSGSICMIISSRWGFNKTSLTPPYWDLTADKRRFSFWHFASGISTLGKLAPRSGLVITCVDWPPILPLPILLTSAWAWNSCLRRSKTRSMRLSWGVVTWTEKMQCFGQKWTGFRKSCSPHPKIATSSSTKLGDFESWPEFREEYDLLATQYEAMKRQRAREEISHEQLLHIAREAKP